MSNLKKIVSVETLKNLSKNKSIVHAHGVFDVFHIGHLKHLEVAKLNGDILVVSITSDKYVNKGPSRPFFPQNLRAEFLSSLDIVDFVVINDELTPIKLIKTIKSDFYVKGNDYKNIKKDITGNILKEKKAVESYGGKIIYTDEIEFSSSKIINQFFQPLKIVNEIKNINNVREKSIREINKLNDLKVLVLGEIIFDEYNFVKELDKPGKENIQSVLYKKNEIYIGGSYSLAKSISTFVKKVDLVCMGNFSNEKEKLIIKNSLSEKNLNLKFIKNNFHVITKKRYVNSVNRKLFEEYILEGKNIYDDKKILKDLKNLKKYDLVIIADFGHGLMTSSLINYVTKNSKFLCVNAQTNSENRGYNYITKYKKADYICVDKQEIKLAISDRFSSIDLLIKKLFKKINTKLLTVTLGKEGIKISKKNIKKYYNVSLSGFEVNPIDTLGAGDTVFGISSLLAKKNTDIKLIALISNLVGAMKTKIIGHSATIRKLDVIKALNYTLK